MVQTHQKAQYLLYLTSFVVNVHKKVHILTHLSPVMLQKHQIAEFVAVFDIICNSLCINEVHILIYLSTS